MQVHDVFQLILFSKSFQGICEGVLLADGKGTIWIYTLLRLVLLWMWRLMLFQHHVDDRMHQCEQSISNSS